MEQARRDAAAASVRTGTLTAEEQPWLFYPETEVDSVYPDRNELRWAWMDKKEKARRSFLCISFQH